MNDTVVAPKLAFPVIALEEAVRSFEIFRTADDEEWQDWLGSFYVAAGSTVVDSTGAAWVVHGVEATRDHLPHWRRKLAEIFSGRPVGTLNFVARDPAPWSEVIEWVCGSVDDNQDLWYDDGTVKDLGFEAQMDVVRDCIRQCVNLDQIAQLVDCGGHYEKLRLVERWTSENGTPTLKPSN